jgi:glucose-6-phosphate 1-dehydrogenase
VKGSKVLRTRKVRWYQSGVENKWNYFCANTCLNDYINEHLQAFIRIAPRREPLETPALRLRRFNTPLRNIIGELDRHILKQL